LDSWAGFFDVFEQPKNITEIDNLIRIPLVRQPDSWSCGVASVLSVLSYYGKEMGYEDIAKGVKATKADGADHRNIITFLKEQGLEVELHKGMLLSDLQSFIDNGTPVIVVIQAWSPNPDDYEKNWDSGHYAVVVGYDLENIYLMDPSTIGNYTYIPREEFSKRWHDQDQEIKLRQAGLVIKGTKAFDADGIKRLR